MILQSAANLRINIASGFAEQIVLAATNIVARIETDAIGRLLPNKLGR